MTCPACLSSNVDRVSVDVGVGMQHGPWSCFDCGWYEGWEHAAADDYTSQQMSDRDILEWFKKTEDD